MTIFLTVIQVICGLLLIGIIMMQSGKERRPVRLYCRRGGFLYE